MWEGVSEPQEITPVGLLACFDELSASEDLMVTNNSMASHVMGLQTSQGYNLLQYHDDSLYTLLLETPQQSLTIHINTN